MVKLLNCTFLLVFLCDLSYTRCKTPVIHQTVTKVSAYIVHVYYLTVTSICDMFKNATKVRVSVYSKPVRPDLRDFNFPFFLLSLVITFVQILIDLFYSVKMTSALPLSFSEKKIISEHFYSYALYCVFNFIAS